jgi:hypothetical protein
MTEHINEEVEDLHNLGTLEELGLDPDFARGVLGKLIDEGRLSPTISKRAALAADPALVVPVEIAHDDDHAAVIEAAKQRGGLGRWRFNDG